MHSFHLFDKILQNNIKKVDFRIYIAEYMKICDNLEGLLDHEMNI